MRALLASDDPARRVWPSSSIRCIAIGRELGSLAQRHGRHSTRWSSRPASASTRRRSARRLSRAAWLGVELDAAANEAGGPRISMASSRVSVWAIPTNEELMIARHTLNAAKRASPDRTSRRRHDGASTEPDPERKSAWLRHRQ